MPHFYGAVGAPKVGHHEWQPHSRRPLVTDDIRFNQGARLFLYETRVFLNEIRWRRRPPEYGLRATAVVLAIVVHLILLFLLMVQRPPGSVPPAGTPDVATIEVRLISQPEPPPPPPPPIKLPRRHVKEKVARHPPVRVKRAPVAAMPPVPQVAPERPEIKLAPSKPTIAPPQPQPQPVQQAAASPQVPTPQVELSPAPPRVVLEQSAMAVQAPEVTDTRMAPVDVPSPALQAVPTMHAAPTIKLGNPALATVQPGEEHGVATLPARVEASTPEVPTVDTQPTAVRIEPAPVERPSIHAPEVTLHAVTAPTAELAPIPQAPDTAKVTPALDLPIAQVPEPQAPDVQAPDVHVDMPPVAAEAAPPPAAASSVRKATAKPLVSADSWAPANDQFKPVERHGEGGAAKRPGTQREGVVQLMPRGNSDVMTRNTDHLGYKPTIFDQYWAPDNESLLDSFLRRFIEKLTVTHTFHLAPGVRVHCVLGPLAIFAACGGDPPRPESARSHDPRLNMAPARPLVPGLGASSPAPATTAPLQLDSAVKCSVARVAGGPPPPGCPGAPPPPSQSDQWHVKGGGG